MDSNENVALPLYLTLDDGCVFSTIRTFKGNDRKFTKPRRQLRGRRYPNGVLSRSLVVYPSRFHEIALVTVIFRRKIGPFSH
jgi:hypothetical protein